MNFTKILSFLTTFAPFLEPVLVDIENNTIQPELKTLINTVTNPELKTFLSGIDAALDAFVKAEIGKI